MSSPQVISVTADECQRRRLKLPKSDLRLADGRVLRRILGHDIRKFAPNAVTAQGILASAGWRHLPSGYIVTATIDDTERWGPLLHVAMSYPDHDPIWHEIKLVRAVFFPSDMDAMLLLPREADYVNAHNYCYHLWQTPEMWGIA